MVSLASGLRPTDAFITSTLQKHLFREMKVADTAVKNPEMMKWNPLNKRYAPTAQNKPGDPDDVIDDDAEDIAREEGASAETDAVNNRENLPEIPTKNNPLLVAIYGQICIAAKSYQSAICRFLSVPRRPWPVTSLV